MKISKWWCISGETEEGKRFFDFLSNLSPGDMFIYKVHSKTYGDTIRDVKYKDQFALMVRTRMRYFRDVDEVCYEGDSDEVDQSMLTSYYDFASARPRHNILASDKPGENDIFDSLNDSQLVLRLGVLGLKPEDLPLFEIEYDDRDVIFGENGSMMIF